MTITNSGLNLGVRNLRDCKTMGKQLSSITEVVRTESAIGIALAYLIDQRISSGGVEMVRNGVLEYVFTHGLSEDVTVNFTMWLLGHWDTKPWWPGYPQLRMSDYPELDGPVKDAAYDVVEWVWDSYFECDPIDA